jgi:cell division protein FtsW (lipid II flippase)
MYRVVLALHNLVRWVVVAVGAWALFRAWRGWLRSLPWTTRDGRAARLFVGVLDVQLLLGLLLYVVFSPLTRRAFHDPGAAMRDAPVRYFFLEHVVIMVAAIAIAHIGLVKVRRQSSDSARFQTAALWLGVALAVIVGFLPWARPLLPGSG